MSICRGKAVDGRSRQPPWGPRQAGQRSDLVNPSITKATSSLPAVVSARAPTALSLGRRQAAAFSRLELRGACDPGLSVMSFCAALNFQCRALYHVPKAIAKPDRHSSFANPASDPRPGWLGADEVFGQP
jgi:hypothetical protein